MELLWLVIAAGSAALLFLWPMRFGAALPQYKAIDLWFKDGTTRIVRKLTPGSADYIQFMDLLDRCSYRRTPAGLFGAGSADPNCSRITLVCGDCAITVRTDGTVSVDGQHYAMNIRRSESLVDTAKCLVTE